MDDLKGEMKELKDEMKKFHAVKDDIDKIKLQITALKAAYDGLKNMSDKTDYKPRLEDLARRMAVGEQQIGDLVEICNTMADKVAASK